MIKLTDFLLSCRVPLDLTSYKIHLATGMPNPPLEAFFAGNFKEWQEGQRNRNFRLDMVVGLIHLESDRWLFAGAYRVLGCEPKPDGFRYNTELLTGQDDLVGRVIVQHKRTARAAYLIGKQDGGQFFVAEYLPRPMAIADFPGYSSVCVTFSRLKIIVDQNVATWRGALGNMKGVYLITDLATGKLYVGSATGNDGLWQRWSNYTKTGHGGNRDLKRVLGKHGENYVDNFQYSLLEVADSRATDDYILGRESFWKSVLGSREFGYNAN